VANLRCPHRFLVDNEELQLQKCPVHFAFSHGCATVQFCVVLPIVEFVAFRPLARESEHLLWNHAKVTV